MLKYGYISNVDVENALVKVRFDENDIVSGWLQVLANKSKEDQSSWPFDIDEHVACMMDPHSENGVVLGAIYAGGNKPDGANQDKMRVKFSDGASIEYDRANSVLTVDSAVDVNINAENITLTVSNAVTVDGDLSVTGDVLVDGDVDSIGSIESVGSITSDGEVTANNLVPAARTTLSKHIHGGVTTGPGSTAVPTPGT